MTRLLELPERIFSRPHVLLHPRDATGRMLRCDWLKAAVAEHPSLPPCCCLCACCLWCCNSRRIACYWYSPPHGGNRNR